VYYFDNNATTLIHNKGVINLINDSLSSANPSNKLNFMGREAALEIEDYRHNIARLLKVDAHGVIFTSGATEANNVAIQGIVNHFLAEKKSLPFTIITSAFEHSSVLSVFKFFAGSRFKGKVHVRFVKPYLGDPDDPEYGCIRKKDVEQVITKSTNPVFMSIMHANNETGAIQDIESIGKLADKHHIIFHTDITQSVGKLDIKFLSKGLCDMFSFSAHKFHGLKGQGCLYISDKVRKSVDPLFFGGHQEMGYRPGTENLAGIAAMSLALANARKQRSAKNKRLVAKKEWILDELDKHGKEKGLNIQVIGAHPNKTLPNTLLIKITTQRDMCNLMLCRALSERCIVVGVGSACNEHKPSQVLKAMAVPTTDYNKVIRISMSDYTTWKECKYLVTTMLDNLC